MRIKTLGLAGILAGLSIFYPSNAVETHSPSESWLYPLSRSSNELSIRSARLAQETLELFTEHDLGTYDLPEPRLYERLLKQYSRF